MTSYRRLYIPGATYFFTVAVHSRHEQNLLVHADWLKACIRAEQHIAPFSVLAAVLLPDHLHMIWRLPEADSQYSDRWRRIKSRFSRALPSHNGPRRASAKRKGEREIWQRRFWEHVIRDEAELAACINYIHMNPIKHGYVDRPDAWEHTTYHAWLERQQVSGTTHRPASAPLAPAAQQLYNLIHQAGKTAKRKPASPAS